MQRHAKPLWPDSYGNNALLYRVIVTVRQQFADSYPHCITQLRQGKSSKYKALEYLKLYMDRHSAPALSVKCCRISTLTLYNNSPFALSLFNILNFKLLVTISPQSQP